MNKYRIKYERNEDAKFISHLDLMRTMNRALRRAKAPLQYTQGFNPHSMMTVALPLSVGITSNCEYLDVTFSEEVDTEKFADKLNSVMPSGLYVKKMLLADEMRAFKHIEMAEYVVRFKSDKAPDCQEFLNMESAVMNKRTKSGEKEENILPDIHSLSYEEKDGNHVVTMRINAGSKRNLKPELVMEAFRKFQQVDAKQMQIERTNIFFDDGSEVF